MKVSGLSVNCKRDCKRLTGGCGARVLAFWLAGEKVALSPAAAVDVELALAGRRVERPRRYEAQTAHLVLSLDGREGAKLLGRLRRRCCWRC